MNGNDRAFAILLCALGGEGGGVLANWLVEVARECGHAVQGTSIPGVAQRTGATTYYIEIFPRPTAQLGGRTPLFGLYAVPGAVDLLVGSELLEVVRQAGNGMVSPDRTAVIASTRRTLTTTEKMPLADGRLDTPALVEVLRRHAHTLDLLDMTELAERNGTVISAVMLGAIGAWIAATGALPFPRRAFEAVVRRSGKAAEASLHGLEDAWQTIERTRRAQDAAVALAAEVTSELAKKAPALPPAVREALPAEVHDIVALGHARVVDYQDAAYGDLYLQRLQRLLHAERAAAAGEAVAMREAARWLALWMAFDDIVRVADLKSRASRRERVRREVNAAGDELLHVYEHFKPGVPEVAGLLPSGLAARLQRWDRARIARGREPFALTMKIGTHTASGLAAMRALASLKWLRRHGQRFAEEQTLIERWLAAIESALRADAPLALELARCGRLIKGYGATNERGKANLLHIVDHLAAPSAAVDAGARADAVRAAREAALADERGQALDDVLRVHGAPPRPPVEQPLRFVRRASS
jgi:indolepyruvate ferredoxin oxidoreductase beta subunit